MILLVEKNVDFAQVYTAIFKSAGYAVTVVPGIAEARLRLRLLDPDLVVMGDWRTSGADSVAFCQRLRDAARTVPVPIVMIGTSWPGFYRAAPFDVFVKKPFYVVALLAAVRRLIKTAGAHPHRSAISVCTAPHGVGAGGLLLPVFHAANIFSMTSMSCVLECDLLTMLSTESVGSIG